MLAYFYSQKLTALGGQMIKIEVFALTAPFSARR